jgi:hypothetical protein
LKKFFWIGIAVIVIAILLLLQLWISGSAKAPLVNNSSINQDQPSTDTNQAENKLVVYYFHGDIRCASCLTIERLTGEALREFFARELGDGRIEWRVVNVDVSGNEHYIKDYQLFTKSVVLSKQNQTKELRWKNLDKVWELLDKEQQFKSYIRSEIDGLKW